MTDSDLPAQTHLISLDLFGLLILTEMNWAEPALEKCCEQLDHMLAESFPIVQ